MYNDPNVYTYPGTFFQIVDKSDIPPLPVAESAYKPLFYCAAATPKGREEVTVYEGKNFYTNVGSDISFVKYGQPLLQAARIINSGGRVMFKRVVASDALLANTAIVAEVKKTTEQKTNAAGLPLYTDAVTGEETTVADGNTPIVVNGVGIEFKSVTITPKEGEAPYDITQIKNAVLNTDEGVDNASYLSGSPDYNAGVTFPLFLITDIGRGVSAKRWRISPDYTTSKSYEIMCYNFEIIENDKTIEKYSFTFNPNSVNPYNGKYLDLKTIVDGKSDQVRVDIYTDAITAFYNGVYDQLYTDPATAKYTFEEFLNMDILFGKTRKNTVLDGAIAYSGKDLNDPYGLTLDGGSNGIFGDCPTAPAAEEELHKQYLAAFNGENNYDIYDLNTYQIDIIADANYPDDVKQAIMDLVIFREDCVAFIDMGTGVRTLEEILLYKEKLTAGLGEKGRYVYPTFLSYDIIDPYTNRQITVTAMYDIVKRLCTHFADGRSRAFAGLKYGVTLESAIKGTVNFIPRTLPGIGSQNEILNDARVNYASYYNGQLVLETEYTANERYTQLSFVNNIFNIQELIKTIRVRCPQTRYTFIDQEGLKEYEADVKEIIDRFAGNYMSIEFKYVEDKVLAQNKIYYAIIEVRFKNFIQTEWFKIIALPSDL